MPFGFLALLAAFGTLANSLRSDNASVLIRTLLRCSARPNGGFEYPTARPLRGPRPNGLFAALTSRGAGVASFLYPHFSQGHGTPCHYARSPHSSPFTSHSSPLIPHSSLLIPHSSPLTPHSYDLTPHSSANGCAVRAIAFRPPGWGPGSAGIGRAGFWGRLLRRGWIRPRSSG